MRRGRKIVAWSFAATVILLLAALVGSSFYMLDFALTPLARSDQEVLDRLASHAPQPVVQWVDSVCQTGVLRDTTVDIDGVPAHAWYLRAPHDTLVTAMLVHGYKDAGLMMMHIAYLYHHDLGWNVLLPDLPAHGHTPGDHIDMGWGEIHTHARAWIDVANEMFRSDSAETRMVLHGISMGAATVMNLSGDSLPTCVQAIVEDCGYTSVWDEFSCQMSESFGLHDFPLMYTTSALCKLRYGWSFGEASCLKQVAKCQLPMLFIHGDSDDFVPTEMVHRLYAAKPSAKQLWLAPGSQHARSYSDHPNEYKLQVVSFLAAAGF
jgi:fermentation-respiration switch protein FrsA (DUF1100 family)